MNSSTPEPALRLVDASKRFGATTAVEPLSLTLPKGAICGFIGPNGSGKTTTLRMILGILKPDSGRVEVLGQPEPRHANPRISYLPEERGLYRKMKVRHQLEFLGRLKGVPTGQLRKRIQHWLERMELAEVSHQKVETLSKGMAQKVQFIGTVLNQPDLLVLDEPFSGLDPVNRETIREAILEMKTKGTTVLFSTHDMASAEVFCERITMLFRGRKVLDGSLAEIQRQHGANIIKVRVQGGRAAIEALVPTEQIRDEGNLQFIRGIEQPQAFLDALRARSSVEYFEVAPPNLQEIFIRIARPLDPDHSPQLSSTVTNQ